jgi:hypothetical protein
MPVFFIARMTFFVRRGLPLCVINQLRAGCGPRISHSASTTCRAIQLIYLQSVSDFCTSAPQVWHAGCIDKGKPGEAEDPNQTF